MRRFEASAEGLTLLGHTGVAHGESDLTVLSSSSPSLPLPVIGPTLPHSLSHLPTHLSHSSLPYQLSCLFLRPPSGHKLSTLPSEAAHLSPPGTAIPLSVFLGSLSQLIKELAAWLWSCPALGNQPCRTQDSFLPS